MRKYAASQFEACLPHEHNEQLLNELINQDLYHQLIAYKHRTNKQKTKITKEITSTKDRKKKLLFVENYDIDVQ